MKHWLVIGIVAALIFEGSSPSFAACSGPTGAEGDMICNNTHHMMQFCDDTDWIAMAGTSSGGGGTPCVDDDTTECLLDATRAVSDPQLLADHITFGVNILGVTGTQPGQGALVGGAKW